VFIFLAARGVCGVYMLDIAGRIHVVEREREREMKGKRE
jgi:hypothetical protein